ncbi:MAG: DNA-processing protein DprA [Pseudomonadota bacterium]
MNNSYLAGKKHFTLSDEQRINWLRLIRSQNVGPATFRDLISHYGTAELALEAIPELAKRGGAAAKIKIYSRGDAEREFQLAQRYNARFIGIGEPEYPSNLKNSDGCPPLICVRGDVSSLSDEALAVVGSRNASIAGMKITEQLTAQVGEAGYKIISGLARGIDTVAHKSALKTGTAAVFAGGVDIIFPEENQKLVSEILENGGALVSEMPIGWHPRAKDFPRRNRIITGLSIAVLVVEAARRSGSLITARLANDMGRTVLAVPGSPLDPRSEGTNSLIRDGAALVANSNDILEALAPITPKEPDLFDSAKEDDLEFVEPDPNYASDIDLEVREKIIAALGPSPVLIDDIIQFTGAKPGEVQLALLELTLAGRLERHPGGMVSLTNINRS